MRVFQIASFQDASAEEVEALQRAAHRARARMKEEGAAHWPHDAESFPLFQQAFDELVEYIDADPRVSGQNETLSQRLAGRKLELVFFGGRGAVEQ